MGRESEYEPLNFLPDEMREIWFKAKRTSDGEWVEGFYVMYSTSIAHPYSRTNGEHYILTVPHNSQSKIDPKSLCQYIGLLDKHRNEIFENDIVKDENGRTAYVTFLQQEMGYVLVYENCDRRLGNRDRKNSYKCDPELEIIGNLLDNKDILKWRKNKK